MQRTSKRRSGFTLIEILVVISIIGVLVAVLVVGIIPLLRVGPELQTTNDIRQLASAVNQFKAKYGVFPPSRIVLSGNANTIAGADPASLNYLMTIWPRIDFSLPIDWSGTGDTSSVFLLEGDQCLVFFLGGIPNRTSPGVRGFSSNPKNPTALATGAKDGFYQFEVGRLSILPDVLKSGRSPLFYSYQDAWGTGMPFAYFSSGKIKNGYNPQPPLSIPPTTPIGDCPTLMVGGPYYKPGTGPGTNNRIDYRNPMTFQIISAGKDGRFGAGGPIWDPGANWIPPPSSPPAVWNLTFTPPNQVDGLDDQTNFYDFKLGVPQ